MAPGERPEPRQSSSGRKVSARPGGWNSSMYHHRCHCSRSSSANPAGSRR
jgi:hypothetical protein